jgi:hypothetical protein
VQYHDFELKVRSTGGQHYEIQVRSSAGEKTSTVSFPFDETALLARLHAVHHALTSDDRRDLGMIPKGASDEPGKGTVEDFGKELFEMLIGGDIRALYVSSRQMAEAKGCGLRLQLRIEPPRLAALPWEFMYDSSEGDFVCLSRETPVVRYVELDRPRGPLSIEPPLRVLGMVASPTDWPPLDVEREQQRVEKATERLRQRGLLTLEWLGGQSFADLQQAMLRGPWNVFHFIGHGGFDAATDEGVIALADDDGSTFRLSATKLGRILADHNTLRLAILNSCDGARASDTNIFSSTASILMKRGLPAVVAMQYEITDVGAIEFAQVFYENIALGVPVDAAVTEARKAMSIKLGDSFEWGTPVLYMRAPDGMLFDIRSTSIPTVTDLAPVSVAPEVKRRARSPWTLLWLLAPTFLLIAGTLASTIWRVPTRIAVAVVTSRITFDVRDRKVALLSGTPGFSRLVIERCGSGSFEAARAGVAGYAGTVRFRCVDRDSKLTLDSPMNSPAGAAAPNPATAATLGSFDRLDLEKGTTVALEAAGTDWPVVTIDLSTPKMNLDLPILRELQLTAEYVETEPAQSSGVVLPTFAATLSDTDRMFHVQSGDRRTTLIVTPAADVETFFDDRTRIPVEKLQFIQETSAGLASAFLVDGRLTYPDYPDVPVVAIRGEDFLVLSEAKDLEISKLGLSRQPVGLAMTIEGRVAVAAIGRPAAGAATEERTGRWSDPRLTVYQILRYGPLWSLVAAVAIWGLGTTWVWYERWKKFSE